MREAMCGLFLAAAQVIAHCLGDRPLAFAKRFQACCFEITE
jgi:hypothetical protein